MGLNSLKTRLFTCTWQPEFQHGSTENLKLKPNCANLINGSEE